MKILIFNLFFLTNILFFKVDSCIGEFHYTVTNAWNEYQENLASCSGFSASHCRREAEAIFFGIVDNAVNEFDDCNES